jgi:uncharacterized membrane protein SirB2
MNYISLATFHIISGALILAILSLRSLVVAANQNGSIGDWSLHLITIIMALTMFAGFVAHTQMFQTAIGSVNNEWLQFLFILSPWLWFGLIALVFRFKFEK